MAKRNEGQQSGIGSETGGAPTGARADTVEQKVVAFAEQLGRIVGTVQAKAEGWMDRDALRAQVSHVRDSAADLLQQLGGGASKDTAASTTRNRGKAASKGAAKKGSAAVAAASVKTKGRSGGVVDAPGKRHRKPLPNTVRPKATADSRIASAADARVTRMKVANTSNRRGRG
jgi:hypothetical protein